MIDRKGASLTCNTKKLTENRNREMVKGEVENVATWTTPHKVKLPRNGFDKSWQNQKES